MLFHPAEPQVPIQSTTVFLVHILPEKNFFKHSNPLGNASMGEKTT